MFVGEGAYHGEIGREATANPVIAARGTTTGARGTILPAPRRDDRKGATTPKGS